MPLQLNWEPKVSAPSHSQYLPFMKLSAALLLIPGSLEVLVAAQPCWLSFSPLGELSVLCKHRQVPGGSPNKRWREAQRPRLAAVPAGTVPHPKTKACLRAQLDRVWDCGSRNLTSGVGTCMLTPACRHRQTHMVYFVHITLIFFMSIIEKSN